MKTNDLNAKTAHAAQTLEGYRLSLISEPRRISAKFQGKTVAGGSHLQ